VLRQALPWFEDPLDFLSSTERMERESRSLDLWADDQRSSRIFHITRGSVAGPIWLPWLDAECALLIAVNRHPGASRHVMPRPQKSETGSGASRAFLPRASVRLAGWLSMIGFPLSAGMPSGSTLGLG